MKRILKRTSGWLGDWRRYCVLLAVLFGLRGVFLLCVLPPFEGWDEYQHLAYVVHLIEKGEPPDLAEGSQVPRSMYPWLVAYPHCRFATDQLAPIGALSYEAYWDSAQRGEVAAHAPAIPIYQAQHPSLYYRMMTPIVRWFLPDGDVRSLVAVLRLVNVGFGALSVYLAARLIGVLIVPSALRYLLGLLIGLQPLYLLNCARVASDALAVLLGTAAIGMVLVPSVRYRALGGAATGAVIGLSIMAKTVNIALAPFGILVAALSGWRERVGWKKAAPMAGAMASGLIFVCGAYFYHNLTTFGLLTPMQEAVQNRASGKTLNDVLVAAREMDLGDELVRRFYRRSLWTGGWSYLQPPSAAVKVQEFGYYFASLGFLFALAPAMRRRRSLSMTPGLMPRVFLLCALTAAGLCYHMVHTRMLLGSVATNIWYAAVVFPWFLVLYVQGLAYWPAPWVGVVPAVILGATFMATEIHGALVTMLSTYSGGASGAEALRRIAELHPEWLSPAVGGAALVGVLMATGLAVGAAIAGWSRLDVVHEQDGHRAEDHDRQPGG